MRLEFNAFMVRKIEEADRYELIIMDEHDERYATMEFTNVNDLWQRIGKLLKGDLV